MNEINLNECKVGDILISSQGVKLEYVCKTPYQNTQKTKT